MVCPPRYTWETRGLPDMVGLQGINFQNLHFPVVSFHNVLGTIGAHQLSFEVAPLNTSPKKGPFPQPPQLYPGALPW